MTYKRYNSIYNFVRKHCPRPNHFCSGKGIGEDNKRIKNKEKCEYYICGKCTHPRRLVFG